MTKDTVKPRRGRGKEAAAEFPDKAAIEYARKAYDAAIEHYYANKDDAFARSRLPVVYGEQQPGDVNMIVTLPGRMRDKAFTDEEVRDWVKRAEIIARTLEHEGCTDAFKTAFGVIFTEHMLDGSNVSWTTPEVMRVMLPLVMLDSSGNSHSGDTLASLDILISLSCELVGDEVDRGVRKSLGME